MQRGWLFGVWSEARNSQCLFFPFLYNTLMNMCISTVSTLYAYLLFQLCMHICCFNSVCISAALCMHIYCFNSVCISTVSTLYAYLLFQLCMHICCFNSVCISAVSTLYAYLLFQLCMHIYCFNSVCISAVSTLYAYLLFQLCMHICCFNLSAVSSSFSFCLFVFRYFTRSSPAGCPAYSRSMTASSPSWSTVSYI